MLKTKRISLSIFTHKETSKPKESKKFKIEFLAGSSFLKTLLSVVPWVRWGHLRPQQSLWLVTLPSLASSSFCLLCPTNSHLQCGNTQWSIKWEDAKAIYSELAMATITKGVSHGYLWFGRDLKTNRGVRKIYGRKRECLGYITYALIGGSWHGASGGRLARNGATK